MIGEPERFVLNVPNKLSKDLAWNTMRSVLVGVVNTAATCITVRLDDIIAHVAAFAIQAERIRGTPFVMPRA